MKNASSILALVLVALAVACGGGAPAVSDPTSAATSAVGDAGAAPTTPSTPATPAMPATK